MLHRFRALIVALAAVSAALIALAVPGPAWAITPPSGLSSSPTNTPETAASEAGFYALNNGMTRFRYDQATLTASPTLQSFIGTLTPPGFAGASGVELCDPTTQQAVQVGLVFNQGLTTAEKAAGDTGWEIHYASGTFTAPPPKAGDLCVQNGILKPLNFLGAATPLDTDTVLTGDPNYYGGAGASQTIPEIGANDQIQVSLYYTNPNSGARRAHDIQIQVVDITQDYTFAQVLIPVRGHSTLCSYNGADRCFPNQLKGQENWYEAGIGLFSPFDTLTGGTVNAVASYTNTAFNYYSSTSPPTTIVSPHWRTKMAQTINATSQVVLSPTPLASLSGPVPSVTSMNMFTVYSGSTTP